MHAVTVRVEVLDRPRAEQELRENVIPRIQQAPGFVAGYWMAPSESTGWSLVLFDGEEQAKAMIAELRANPERPDSPVKIADVGDVPVIAHA